MDFNAIWESIRGYLSAATDGLSLASVIGLFAYGLKAIGSFKNNGSKLEKALAERVDSAINAKIIPNTVKMDISAAVNRELSRTVKRLEEQQLLSEKKNNAILKILTRGTIFSAMPAADRAEILALTGETVIEPADLEVHLLSSGEVVENKENTTDEKKETVWVS